MSKVKLVIAEGYGSEARPYRGGDEVINLNLEVPYTHSITGIIRTEFDPDKDRSVQVSDDLIPVVPLFCFNHLVGKLLTLTDATFSDPEQRKAFKDVLRQIAYDWHHGMVDNLVSPWRKDKGISVQ